MKRTLKRELKGLEVVKMETNGFSTDRGANQGVMVATWAASGEGSLELDRAVPSLLFSRYFASPLRSVSMSARSGRKAAQVR